ncbi:hypothetical protein GCM10017673_45800 [Streptosporangium violaceochromogenes]|nr:hypothetical protein GCM10017673_45800 [Streptosporangium violaceochromogenes]
MKVSRRVLTVCAATLVTGGALTSPPVASGHGALPAHTARAAVTDLREVVNQLPDQVDFLKQEDGTGFRIPPTAGGSAPSGSPGSAATARWKKSRRPQ